MGSLALEVLFLFIAALGFQYLLPLVFKGFGQKKELAPERFRWALSSKPLTGGLGMFLPVLLMFVFQFLARGEIYEVLPLFCAALLLGLLDDWYALKPFPKLGGQLLCGVLAWFSGLQLEWTHLPFLDFGITCLALSALMNSINMLDNMDAVAGFAVMGSILPWISGTELLLPHPFWWIVVCILGFLVFNHYPSKVFMGDSGSHFLGAVLFWLVTELVKWNPVSSMDIGATGFWLFALLFFPLTDTLVVTISRIFRGQSPFVGGRDHLSHMLVKGGLSQVRVAWLIGGVNLALGYFLRYYNPSLLELVAVGMMLFFGFSAWYIRVWKNAGV